MMHRSAQFISLLLLLLWSAGLRFAASDCVEIVSKILFIEEADSSSHGGCSPSSTNSSHRLCSDFQSALDLLANSSLSECWDASIVLRLGQNVIEKPVYLSTYSLLLIGSGPASTIVCEKFECESTAGQHSIYFNRSHSVRIEALSSESCPCPFRFDSVVNVSVQASTFRFAGCMLRVCAVYRQAHFFIFTYIFNRKCLHNGSIASH